MSENNRYPDKNSFVVPSSNNVESATINLDDSESQNEMAQRIREMKEKLRRQMDGMEKGQDYAISETTYQQPDAS